MKHALAVVSLGLLSACHRDEPAPPDKPPPGPAVTRAAPARPAELTRVTIKALGMTCEESCPIRVRLALADIPTIYELGFDLTHESVFISYDQSLGDPKAVTKPMLAAIKLAGFDPWLAKTTWPADATAHVVMR